MKKWLTAGLIVLLGVGVFFGYKHLHTQELRPEADWDRETDSVVTLDEKDKYPLDTRTFSNIKVKKVFKGDDLVKEGDELPVLEYYANGETWQELMQNFQMSCISL